MMPLSQEKQTKTEHNKNKKKTRRFSFRVDGQLVFSRQQRCVDSLLSLLEPSFHQLSSDQRLNLLSCVLWQSLPVSSVLFFTPADTAAPQAGAANLQLQAMHWALLSSHHTGWPDVEGERPRPLPADRQGNQWEVAQTIFLFSLELLVENYAAFLLNATTSSFVTQRVM